MTAISKFSKFDSRQLFRLFVDGRFQKKTIYNGFIGYERKENGSVKAILNALTFAVRNINENINITSLYLSEIHKIAMMGVHTKNNKTYPGEIRWDYAGLPMFRESTSYENIKELILDRPDTHQPLFFDSELSTIKHKDLDPKMVYQLLNEKRRLRYKAWMPVLTPNQKRSLERQNGLRSFYEVKGYVQKMIIDELESILANYNNMISSSTSGDQRLRGISWLIRELEILHPFSDGNCRVFACVLLTKLLLLYEFVPALLVNPNLDFELSHDQWFDEIVKGMKRTDELILNPEMSLFEFKISDLPNPDISSFSLMASEFSSELSSYHEIYLTPERLNQFTPGYWIPYCPTFLRFRDVSLGSAPIPGSIYFATLIPEWESQNQSIKSNIIKIIKKGIRAIVIDNASYLAGLNIPVYLVKDINQALIDVAKNVRLAADPKTVLITGTEGKTGAKMQLAHLICKQGKVHALPDSGNLFYSVHRSLASIGAEDQVELTEMAVVDSEINTLERAMHIRPNLCFFTNISTENMHYHKSLEGVMTHKAAVVGALVPNGYCLINDSIEDFEKFFKKVKQNNTNSTLISYGLRETSEAKLIKADFDNKNIGWSIVAKIGDTKLEYYLPLINNHSPVMSVGVLLAIKLLGYDLQRASQDYASFKPYESMGNVFLKKICGNDIIIYDQSRRSSIAGIRSAFQDIKNLNISGKVVALLGSVSATRTDQWASKFHNELAGLINESPIEKLYTAGPNMEIVHVNLLNPEIFILHSDNIEELYRSIIKNLNQGDLFYVQGYMRLNLHVLVNKLINGKIADLSLPAIERPELSNNVSENYDSFLKLFGKPHPDHATNKLFTADSYLGYIFNNFTFTSFRTYLLMRFFHDVNFELTGKLDLKNANNRLVRSGYSKYIYSKYACDNWFTKKSTKANFAPSEAFGTFFLNSKSKFMLAVMLGTKNLHIGFVRYYDDGENFKFVSCDEQDTELVISLLNLQHYKYRITYKKWGPGWLSIDCGSFIDLTNYDTFKTYFAFNESPVCHNILIPIAEIYCNKFLAETV